MKELSYLNKYLLKYKYHLILGTIFIIISNFFSILPAQIVRHAFDLIKESIDIYILYSGFDAQTQMYGMFASTVLLYGALILVMVLIRGFFLFLVRQTMIVMSRHIEYDLKNEIYEHYQTLPLSFYRKNNTGDLMARISEDVSQVRMYLGPAIMYGINLSTLCIMVITYMFMVDTKLALFTLLPLPFLSISIYYVNNIINRRSEEIQKSLSGLSTFVQEAFSGIRVLKAFVREQDSAKNFDAASEDYRQKSLGLAKVQALFFPLIISLIGLSSVLVIYIGGIGVMNGSITAGNVAEFIMYVNMLTWPVAALGWITSITQRAAASQKRINEFLKTKTDIISEKNIEAELVGEISFKNVDFIYPDSGINALKKVSFDIKSGETLAILGTTGSGKSTVAALVTRMYDTHQGEVLIDGRNIKDYNIPTLRQQIGYVPQDVFLFSDSIKDNITFGTSGLTQEQVEQAAKDADLHHNILDFKHQYDTRIGERGITLSGGQKQRLSIARAIVREPKILILDDSLSAVDTKTENAILNSLKRIMKDRTSIIISHRVSSAKLADKILVLDDGVIVEQGNHEELIKQNGAYKELYDKQLQTEEGVK
ncbi:ABC transporter ATP-binding protein [Microscilla marina]|uniref:ATPase n=1 Tax=Microscilla marina ATCC 23134 TaxID=313606 RepID=A1ZKN6_MICM2|nr:ABC transporter ATP-binding protein [Microscilla marina]EAY28852.1 ATPase [Microscilla marina ATCC 23134]